MPYDRQSVWKLPAVSGVFYGLSLYSGLLIPNLVLFLPVLLWLDLNEKAPGLRKLWAGFAFGAVAHALSLYFTYAMLRISWLAAVLYAGMVLAFALKVSVTIGILGWLRARTRWSFAVLLPVSWLSIEWLQSWGDLKMTADHVGQTLGGFPFLVQFADLGGTYGVGAVLLAFNALLYESLYGFYGTTRRRAGIALVVLVAAVLVYDGQAWIRGKGEIQRAEKLRVGFVQPNVPLEVKWDDQTAREQWDVLERLTRRAADDGAGLVVWPESSRPRPLYHLLEHPATYSMHDVQRLARELGIPLLVGAEYYRVQLDESYELYNAAFLAHPDGRLDTDWGAKVYLVPFTEQMPFQGVLAPLIGERGGEWRWVTGGFTPGADSALLPVDGARIGVLVCYEHFFPDLARRLKNRGATLQTVITNDAWFGRSLFQEHQVNSLRLRAIENRTSFVRAANTGYSGFVDPLGRVHDRTALFVEAVSVRDLSLGRRPTLYNRIGDVVAWAAVAGLAVMAVVAVARGRMRDRPH